MSLNVVYGTRRFKIPVNPSTLLSQVRQQICASLKLSPEEDYVLLHGGKPIDLTRPFRQSGLVNNAALEFKKNAIATSDPQNQLLVIKIRVLGGKDIVEPFKGTTLLSEVLSSLNLAGALSLNGQKLESSRSLNSLGGSRLLLTLHPSKNAEVNADSAPVTANDPNKIPIQSTKTSPTTSNDEINSRTAKFTEKPSTISRTDLEEPPAEPTRSQFLAYYHQLKSQGEPPMLSKETREKMQAASRSEVTETTVRIKFPDQSLLEGKFRNGELGQDLFDFLRMYLADPTARYELVSVRPSFVLGAGMMLSTQLGSRAMLLFRPKTALKSPFLNEKAHKLAAAASAGPSVPTPANESAEKVTKSLSAGPKPHKRGVPKWLKLHK